MNMNFSFSASKGRTLSLVLLHCLLLTTAFAQRPRSSAPMAHNTPTEIVFSADVVGADTTEDLVIIDREKGTFIIGKLNTGNQFDWTEARNLGLTDIASAALGHFTQEVFDRSAATENWSFAVTSPTFNRVQFVPLDGSDPPASADVTSPEPQALAGHDSSTFPKTRFITGFKNSTATTPPLTGTVPGSFDGGWSLGIGANPSNITPIHCHPSYSPALGFLADADGAPGKRLQFVDTNGFFPILIGDVPNLPADTGFTAGQFIADTAWTGAFGYQSCTILAWSPSDSILRVSRVANIDDATSTNLFDLTVLIRPSYNMSRPMKDVKVLTEGNGRILIVWGDAAGGASVYDFDGRNAPVFVDTVPFNGLDLDAAIPTAHSSFILIGSRNGMRAYDRIHFDGTHYSRFATGPIPDRPATPIYSNIIAFNGEPFVNPTASERKRTRVKDWTQSPIISGSMINFSALTDNGYTAGLGTVLASSVSTSSDTTHALANQLDAASSVALFTNSFAMPASPPIVTISLPSGTYAGPTLDVTLSSSAQMINYSINGGAWVQLGNFFATDQHITINTSSTLRAYGRTLFGRDGLSGQGPIVSATYTLSTPPAVAAQPNTDANHNGLSDAWEDLTGIGDPGGDADGDGFLNLQEHNYGSDPGNASDKPGPLVLTPSLSLLNTLPSPTSSAELRWDAGDTAIVLEASSDLHSWSLITTGINRIGNENVFPMPTKVTPRSFYRLRR